MCVRRRQIFASGQRFGTVDEILVDLNLVAGGNKHHLGAGDFENVAGLDLFSETLFNQDVVDAHAISAIDANMPATFILGKIGIIINRGVMTGDYFAGAQVDMNGKSVFEVCDGTGSAIDSWTIVGRSPKIDRLFANEIGPVATGNLCIGRDLLRAIILLFIIGMLDTGDDGILGGLEVGDDGIDQVDLRDFFCLISRIMGGRLVVVLVGVGGGGLSFGG